MERNWHALLPSVTEIVNAENLHEFYNMIFERQEIWWRRNVLKLSRPWTEDPILATKAFTNVYRELDRSSQYLIHNIIRDTSITALEDLLFKMMIFRFYNKTQTFTHATHAIALPAYKTFNVQTQWEQTVALRECGENPWHSAYLMYPGNITKADAGWVDTEQRGMFRDHVFCKIVFKKVHSIIPQLVKLFKTQASPIEIINLYITIDGVALFMATEFYLDLTYIPVYRDDFEFPYTPDDFWNVGPGCSTGIRMIFPILTKKEQYKALGWIRDLAEEELAKIGDFKYVKWDKAKQEYVRCGFNLNMHSGSEFSLCEYQKYRKNQWGLGKQKGTFIPYK